MESWVAGTSAAPDGWSLAGASAAVAREATIIKVGTYSAKLTRSGADTTLAQDIKATKGIAYWKSRTVTFSCWVYATVAGRARLYIHDDVSESDSSWHTGDSTWQLLTVTKTVGATATSVICGCQVAAGNTSAYFDGAICVEGSSIAENLSLDNWDRASLTISGLYDNLLTNGNFQSWLAGTSVAPTGWILAGASATVAREATIIKLGTYSAKLTRAGTDCVLYQEGPSDIYIRSKTYTFGAWVYATASDRVRLLIGDNVSANTLSSFHTGDSTWQWLTVTKTLDASAVRLDMGLYIVDGNTSGYISGAVLVESSSIPKIPSLPTDYWLDGDQDVLYKLIIRFRNGYAGQCHSTVRLNNDSGANYGRQYLQGHGTDKSADRETANTSLVDAAGWVTTINYCAFATTLFYAKSGNIRTVFTDWMADLTGTTIRYAGIYGFNWNNSADIIASFVLATSQTNGFGVGTEIELYKLVKKV